MVAIQIFSPRLPNRLRMVSKIAVITTDTDHTIEVVDPRPFDYGPALSKVMIPLVVLDNNPLTPYEARELADALMTAARMAEAEQDQPFVKIEGDK